MVTRALASALTKGRRNAPPIVLKAALQGSGMAPSSLAPLRVIVKPYRANVPVGEPPREVRGMARPVLAGNGSVEV